MKETVLSVIVPIYNGSSYLDSLVQMIEIYFGEAEKIIGKSKKSIAELILIDDGSVDDTCEKCAAYAERYDWIGFIHTENHGVSHARNTGLEAASGTWIQFLDVDDVIEADMFQAFYQMEADLIVCGCKRVHGNNMTVLCGPKEDTLLLKADIRRLCDQLHMEDRYWLFDYCWNKWYKKDLIDAYGLRFPEGMSLGEDFVFNTQYMQWMQRLGLRKTCYYQYRVGEHGLVSRFQKEPWIGRMKQYKAQKALYQTMDLWKENEAVITCHYGQIAFGDLRMVNSPNCSLSTHEKIKFIRKVMDSPLYGWILCYLESRTSKVFQLYAKAWKKRNVSIIFSFIQMEKGKAYLEKFRRLYHNKKDLQIKKNRIPIIEENQRKLIREGFTILSQNCIGGVFYHDMNMEFLSPTVNLFFEAGDFISFVNDIEYYLSLEIKMSLEKEYPIGWLDDVKVHFYHYTTAREAQSAWERRKKRVNFKKIVVISTDRDGFDDKVFEKWCRIPYPKVLFTANKNYAEHPDVIYYPEFEKEGCVNNDLIERRMFYRDDKLMNRINRL